MAIRGEWWEAAGADKGQESQRRKVKKQTKLTGPLAGRQLSVNVLSLETPDIYRIWLFCERARREGGRLTNSLSGVIKNTCFENLLLCVFGDGKKRSGGHSELQYIPEGHQHARLEEGSPIYSTAWCIGTELGGVPGPTPPTAKLTATHTTPAQQQPNQQDKEFHVRNRKAQLSCLKILIPPKKKKKNVRDSSTYKKSGEISGSPQ